MDVDARVASLLNESAEDRGWERRSDWDYVTTLENNVSVARSIKGKAGAEICRQKLELAEKTRLRTQTVWERVDAALRGEEE